MTHCVRFGDPEQNLQQAKHRLSACQQHNRAKEKHEQSAIGVSVFSGIPIVVLDRCYAESVNRKCIGVLQSLLNAAVYGV